MSTKVRAGVAKSHFARYGALAFERAAWRAAGVGDVDNRIVIGTAVAAGA